MASIEMKTFRQLGAVAVAALIWMAADVTSAQVQREQRDLVFAAVDGKTLALDLYLPDTAEAPLVVWVHGGAWNSGTKASVPKALLQALLQQRMAVASVDFRQASEAKFPAQIHDIKAAIRFLRAKAASYGYRTDKVAIAGSSSGAHLAALVGVTNGHPHLEGTIGDHLQQSSSVQAIVSYFGASNLTTILAQSTPFGVNVRRPALERLLGALPDQAPELATLASPVTHVDAADPPMFLLHGDQDPQMPINQSHELHGAYVKFKMDVHFQVVHGAAHGGEVFYSPEHLRPVVAFLQRTVAASRRKEM
jgi:acetyl esterase/lipase